MKKLLDLIESEQRNYTQEYIDADSIKEKKMISERILALDIVLYKAVELEIEDSSKYDAIANSLNSIIAEINSVNNIGRYVEFDIEALLSRIHQTVSNALDSVYALRDRGKR